jgi:transcription initiation factor TFIIA large subunit
MAQPFQQDMNTPPLNQQQPAISLPPAPLSMPAMPQMNNGPRIKAEPGVDNGMNMAPPAYNGAPNGMSAQQRAAHNLQMQYGARAAASINTLHSGMPQPNQQQQNGQPMMQQQQAPQLQRPTGPQMQRPQMNQGQATAAQIQYRQNLALQTVQQAAHIRQQASQTGQNGVNNAQNDGAGEDDTDSYATMNRIDSHGKMIEMGRVEIDNMIRRKIEQNGQAMEGGGLMLPLHKRATAGKDKKRKAKSDASAVSSSMMASSSTVLAQMDGGDDDDDSDDKDNVLKAENELDEDAINSDLDDSDDGLNEEEDDDDSMGHIMLCMYDKVQRVKNKW